MSTPVDGCELCRGESGKLVLATDHLRVVLVDEPDYPGYLRVVWNDHVRELTDLTQEDRARLMAAVYAVESAIRTTMKPVKVNVASLGNMTPHLHWHVIPRYADDPHFPQSVWTPARRMQDPDATAARRALLPALELAIATQFIELE